MIETLKLYLICILSTAALDFVWLGFVVKKLYIEKMGPLARIEGGSISPVLWSASLVYLVIAIGIVHFALPKLDSDSSWISAFLNGALLGFVIYATYDLTNYSTLKDWSLELSLADIAWGTVLCGIVTCAAFMLKSKI